MLVTLSVEGFAEALALAKGLQRRFEGFRARPYRCPAGIPTIGYGATGYPDGRKVALSDPPITRAQGEALLDHDSSTYLSLAVRYSPRLAAFPPRAAAVGDFCFNLGGARYRASTLKRKIDAGDWPAAVEQLRKWVWGGGRRLPGLVARRAAEGRLVAPRAAAAPPAAIPASSAKATPPPAPANDVAPAAALTRAELVEILTRARATGGDPYEALLEALRQA